MHTARTALVHVVLVTLTVAHLACSATEPSASGSITTATTAKTTSALALPAAGSPASTLIAGGTYWFAFDDSSVATLVASHCAETQKTPAAVQACIDGVRQEGAKEAIRFSSAGPGQLTWTSFGVASGHEEIFLEVPLAIDGTTGTLVQTHATGPASGAQLRPGDKGPSVLAFDVIDAQTVAMADPDKGRLVFRTRP